MNYYRNILWRKLVIFPVHTEYSNDVRVSLNVYCIEVPSTCLQFKPRGFSIILVDYRLFIHSNLVSSDQKF